MPKVVKIKQKIGDRDVKTKFEFNTEDIGMSITTTMKTEFFKESAAEVMKFIVSDGPKLKKYMIEKLGESGYKEYIRRYNQDQADYALWANEIDNNGEVEIKVRFYENGQKGKGETFINGRKQREEDLPKDMVEKLIEAFRLLVIHGEMPKDLR